jgi:hypothetical protein
MRFPKRVYSELDCNGVLCVAPEPVRRNLVLNLTGLPALDLAIGLALIYFLLSTLAATVQELIAAIFGLRARTLEQGLRSMLEDPAVGWTYVDKFYDHPLIKSLYRTPSVLTSAAKETQQPTELGRNAGVAKRSALQRAAAFFRRTKGPSYISPRSFALVVLDNFAPAEGQKTFFENDKAAIAQLPKALRERLEPMNASAQSDVERLRTHLEAWFDDTMARVSGWYKRKTQIILIVIGIALVPAINANTIKMAERMWKDDTVRAAVVAQAQATAKPGSKTLDQAANDVDKVVKVGIPMGWSGAAVPHGAGGIAMSAGGWILTILAISLGAPFWFDTLSRLSRLRSSGKPETPLPAAGSGKANERILTPPQAPPSEPRA